MKSLFFLPKPFSLTLAVTYRCQSRCLTCRIWEIYQKDKEKAKKEFNYKDYLPLFTSLQNNLIHLGITGGEPFLKEDLEKLIALASEKLNKLSWISITSNGFASQKIIAKTKKILKVYPGNLSLEISLDGNEQLHDQIRGLPGSYEKALRTYAKLNALTKKNSRLRVSFSYTISSLNLGQFDQFYSALKKDLNLGLEKVGINFEHFGLLYQRKGNLKLSQEGQEKLKKDIDFILKKTRFKLTFDFFRWGKAIFKRFYLTNLPYFGQNPQRMILPCVAASSSFFIDPYGDIYPCTIWEKNLGNIKTLDLEKFWSSSVVKETQKAIKKQKCPICFTPCEAQIAFISNLPFSLFKAKKSFG